MAREPLLGSAQSFPRVIATGCVEALLDEPPVPACMFADPGFDCAPFAVADVLAEEALGLLLPDVWLPLCGF